MTQNDMPCAKWTVFSINLLFGVLGLAIAAGGVVNFIMVHSDNIVVELLLTWPVLSMIIGSVIFIFSILGLSGALAKSPCLVLFSSIVMFIVLTLQMGTLMLTSIKHTQADDVWTGVFEHSLENYQVNKAEWDFMQTQLTCCGINNANDWDGISEKLPKSCCSESKADECTKKLANDRGCKPALYNFFDKYSWLFFGIGTGVAILQIVLFGLTFSLYGAYRKHNDVYELDDSTSF